MKIETLPPDTTFHRRRANELKELLAYPTDRQRRPCPGCSIRCPTCGSTACTCNCSSFCADAPMAMTSDPEAFPIEPQIVPLVYSLHALGVCPPCWSCEGHTDASGALARKPGVWFYSRSLAYPGLIAHYLDRLKFERTLNFPWRVRVVEWGESLDTGFAIEPEVGPESGPRLALLHRDIVAISREIVAGVKDAAAKSLRDVELALTGHSRFTARQVRR